MFKKVYWIFLIFFINIAQAQEFNCSVSLSYDQLDISKIGSNTAVFEKLKQVISDFMNNRKWTNDYFSPEERINCSLQINLINAPSIGNYEGSAIFTVSRPIYGTNYESSIFRFSDKNFNFQYLPDVPLDFNENNFTNNLQSMLAFYSYLAIGIDYDSFGRLDGTAYLTKAQSIALVAQQSAYSGWKPQEDNRNRHWLMENLMSQQMFSFREGLYEYHRKVLDKFLSQPEMSQQTVLDIIVRIREANTIKPCPTLLNSFFEAKTDELVNIFSVASVEMRKKAYSTLVSVDPLRTANYRKLITIK